MSEDSEYIRNRKYDRDIKFANLATQVELILIPAAKTSTEKWKEFDKLNLSILLPKIEKNMEKAAQKIEYLERDHQAFKSQIKLKVKIGVFLFIFLYSISSKPIFLHLDKILGVISFFGL